MAVGNFSPSGFSYAQAARGTAAPSSQTSSSKVTSGVATPANSISLEASSGGNWADDVEESEGTRTVEPQKADSAEKKASLPRDNAVDRTKVEEKLLNGVSGLSSPDVTGSSTASSATRDDSPSAPTGSSSDITSDTKSQASEPAWIAERKERQNGSHGTEGTAKPERKGKKNNASTPQEEPKAVVLQEAAPPTVNPWQRRAEEAKAKTVASPKAAPAPTNATLVQKENQRPSTSTPRKPAPASTAQHQPSNGLSDGNAKSSSGAGKRTNEVRISNRQSAKPSTTDSKDGRSARSGTPQSRSAPDLTSSLPSVKDEMSWPTPETAQDKERKEFTEKASDDKRDDENTPSIKRKKEEWKPMVVTPNVIWETPSMNEPRERKPRAAAGERGGRGGGRGRGSLRGGASAANGGERNASRSSPPPAAGVFETTSKAAAPTGERTNGPTSTKQSTSPSTERKSTQGEPLAPHAQATHSKDASTQIDAAGLTPEARRARSPKKSSGATISGTDDIATPAPIPRQTPTMTQSVDLADRSRSDPPVRMVPTENRRESRNGDVFRDPAWTGAPRGNKRNSRGRGGHGAGLSNGHGYGNNFQTDFHGSSPYGVPPSPSGYPRGNHHQFGYLPSSVSRGGWARGGPRSHSIPIEGYYPRFGSQQYGNGHGQMASMNAYIPGYSDLGPIPPLSAIMPSPQEAHENLMMMVTVQLEYYFGVENLIRDIFLRKHMDSQGFVFLDFIAGFNRLKQLTSDKDLLKIACLNSEIIEICVGEDGKERLRKREGWQQFVRPSEERDPSAQTEGPQRLQHPERPQLSMPNGPSSFPGPYSAGPPAMHQRTNHRSYDSGMSMNGFAPQFVPNGDFTGSVGSVHNGKTNGEEMRGRSAKSPVYENGVGPNDRPFTSTADEADLEPDAFPNEQVEVLGIVVRTSEQAPPYHSAASRTFSNGSIDSRSIAAELDKKAPESEGNQLSKGSPQVNGDDKLRSLSRHLSPNKARSPEQGPPNAERQVCWAKDVNNIPEGTTYEPYTQLRLKALDQRSHAATGTCPHDLDVLYQFWCHFLCRNFNNAMYGEFRYFAQLDLRERHSTTGLTNLLKFYAHSLNSFDAIRDRIARDYVDLVKNEPQALEGAAFKQLRSAWRNGALNLKNRKKMADVMDEELKVALDKTEA